jgi:hypothetical protein
MGFFSQMQITLDFFSPGFVQYLDFFLDALGITSAGGPVNLLLGDSGVG